MRSVLIAPQRASLSLLLSCLFFFVGCQSPKPVSSPLPRQTRTSQKVIFAAMGSPWTLEYIEPETKSFSHAEMERLFQKTLRLYEETFSDWSADSELRRLEAQGLNSPSYLKASPLFIEGLEFSKEAYTASNGAFDLSVGAVIWKERSRPAGMLTLSIVREAQKFRFGVNPARLSFGGIAKGMSLGELAERLGQSGLRDFRIEAGGGNSVVSGTFINEIDAESKVQIEPSCEGVYFISRSASHQNEKQHIFNPKDISVKLSGSIRLTCLTC